MLRHRHVAGDRAVQRVHLREERGADQTGGQCRGDEDGGQPAQRVPASGQPVGRLERGHEQQRGEDRVVLVHGGPHVEAVVEQPREQDRQGHQRERAQDRQEQQRDEVQEPEGHLQRVVEQHRDGVPRLGQQEQDRTAHVRAQGGELPVAERAGGGVVGDHHGRGEPVAEHAQHGGDRGLRPEATDRHHQGHGQQGHAHVLSDREQQRRQAGGEPRPLPVQGPHEPGEDRHAEGDLVEVPVHHRLEGPGEQQGGDGGQGHPVSRATTGEQVHRHGGRGEGQRHDHAEHAGVRPYPVEGRQQREDRVEVVAEDVEVHALDGAEGGVEQRVLPHHLVEDAQVVALGLVGGVPQEGVRHVQGRGRDEQGGQLDALATGHTDLGDGGSRGAEPGAQTVQDGLLRAVVGRARTAPPLVWVPQEGFEPPTGGLEGRCSVQLSYWGWAVSV